MPRKPAWRQCVEKARAVRTMSRNPDARTLAMNRAAFFPSLIVVACLGGAGCADLSYLRQAVGGHMQLMAKRQDIDGLLTDKQLSPDLAQRLTHVRDMRLYAGEFLGLPSEGSYHSYADLGRSYAVWSVVATPALSIEPVKWCFPILGCVTYRGYYQRSRAVEFARRLQAQGLDVYHAPVPAYSTLGWFDDPVLNTMLAWPAADVAELLFHELAHQVLYLKDDTDFNEAFATMVGEVGAQRWLQARGHSVELAAYRQRLAARRDWIDIVLTTRNRLRLAYATGEPAEQTAIKREAFAELRRARARWARRWPEAVAMARPPTAMNNAYLAAVAVYYRLVPALQALLCRLDHDLPRFYEAVRAMERLSPPQRRERLQASVSAADCKGRRREQAAIYLSEPERY